MTAIFLVDDNAFMRKAMKQLIEAPKGTYDKSVLKALMVRIGLYPVMTYVELSNKQIARVIRQNRQFPLSPTIRVEFDEAGAKLKQPHVIDLNETQFIHIAGPVKKEIHVQPQPSHFAAKEPAEIQVDKYEVIRNVLPIALILSILLLLLYIVIKI